jgi:hypothetical protein
MENQDNFKIENDNTLDDENTEYYENYQDIEDNLDNFESEDLDDDEEIATEKLTPIKLNIQHKVKNLSPAIPSFKDSSESYDMYQTRLGIIKSINETVVKDIFAYKEDLNLFARIINNKFWYNMTYPQNYEKSFDILF